MFKERIEQVQNYLKEANKDAYITFLCDDHGSEYIIDTYKSIAFLCGFTGSAGTLLITKNASYLWTDGRYFLQASKQLVEANTTLKKMGIDETIFEFIKDNVDSLVIDYSVASVSFVNTLKENKPNIELVDDFILNKVWLDRPSRPEDKIFVLPEEYFPIQANTKCHKTINFTKAKDNFGVLVSALDDIAYMLNARGLDIKFNPVFVSFMFLSKVNGVENYTLYIEKKKVSKSVKEFFKSQNINIKDYDKIYDDVSKFDYKIYFDSKKTNFKLYSLMKKKQNKVLWPTLAKSIKSSIEIKESKKTHIKDAIAMCKFMYFVKTKIGKQDLTEIDISDHLEKLRRKQGAFELSFNTICGYNAHGAIIHYGATKESNVNVYKDGILLVDSGGQYFFGTTDITRTFALANLTDEMKFHYTLVLKSHIDLAMAEFEKGTTDQDLDVLTRKPIKAYGLDYNHGTGHGIGHLLNVHEGPQSISFKGLPVAMKKGMVTSDEPGLYFENKYGIRHENEILCVDKPNNKLGFETITYVPYDLDGIDKSYLDEKEINWLNNYHQMVYNKISKYLNKQERAFLKKATRSI